MNRNHPPQRDPETCAIEEKAAEWFGRYELGLTPAEEKEFVQWLESNSRHGEAMRAMDETWDQLDRMRESEKLVWLAKVDRSTARRSSSFRLADRAGGSGRDRHGIRNLAKALE